MKSCTTAIAALALAVASPLAFCANSSSSASAGPAPDPEIVRQAQQVLKTEGYHIGQVDGKWEQDTKTAIGEFQDSNHLPVTGQLDAATTDALGITHGAPRAPLKRSERRPAANGGGEM